MICSYILIENFFAVRKKQKRISFCFFKSDLLWLRWIRRKQSFPFLFFQCFDFNPSFFSCVADFFVTQFVIDFNLGIFDVAYSRKNQNNQCQSTNYTSQQNIHILTSFLLVLFLFSMSSFRQQHQSQNWVAKCAIMHVTPRTIISITSSTPPKNFLKNFFIIMIFFI